MMGASKVWRAVSETGEGPATSVCLYGRQGRYLDLIFGSILTVAYLIKIISSRPKTVLSCIA